VALRVLSAFCPAWPACKAAADAALRPGIRTSVSLPVPMSGPTERLVTPASALAPLLSGGGFVPISISLSWMPL